MAKTITWKDNDDRTCVLTIADGQSAVTTLDAGEEPFVTSIDDTDDLFQTIRTSSGNIGVSIDSVDDIVSLVGRTPITTPVTLKVNGVVRWKGFLACESFSQEWDRGPLDVSLPVVSGLEVAHGIHYPYNSMADLGYINFAQFICNLNTALGGIYTYIYFPNISNPATTLKYKFRMSNYATANDKNTTYEIATYYDILDDICKLFGWQAIEMGEYLIFMAADVKSLNTQGGNCLGYTAANLQNLANGQTAQAVTVLFDKIVPTFYGVDHRRSFVAGKNKVEVVGELNEIDKSIWKMDVFSQCKFNGNNFHSAFPSVVPIQYTVKKMACIAGGNIEVYNNVFSGGASNPDTEGNNIKFVDAFGSSHNVYGGSITYEQFSEYQLGTWDIIAGSTDFVQRLILKAYDVPSIICAKISTNFYYTPAQNTQYESFRIKADVKYAEEARDAFETFTGEKYFEVSFVIKDGDTEYYYDKTNGWNTTGGIVRIRCVDGKMDGETYNGIPVPTNISGELILYIWASTDTDTGQGAGYFAIDNLEIIMYTREGRVKGNANPRIEMAEVREDQNTEKANLNNGFASDWMQTCGLTLARENVPDSNGVVLASDLTYPSSLYDNKYPEKALCDRVAAYAAKARMVLYAVVKSEGAMLSPLKRYAMQSGGRTWICLCQTVNWKNNEVTAGFFEPSYKS